MPLALMIDLETCATTPRAAILQAGWCVFDPLGEPGTTVMGAQMNVDTDSCSRWGGQFSNQTIRWWLRQSSQARGSVANEGHEEHDIEAVLKQVAADFRQHGCLEVWSHGKEFDVKIVEHYMVACGIQPPWKFWDIMDTRTLFRTAERLGWQRPKRETAHTAMADAIAQAEDVQAANAFITRMSKKTTLLDAMAKFALDLRPASPHDASVGPEGLSNPDRSV